MHIEDLFEDHARKGDGAFAIAYALMQIAGHQERIAQEVRRLGLGDASTPFGAIEALSQTVLDAGEAIATAISEAAE